MVSRRIVSTLAVVLLIGLPSTGRTQASSQSPERAGPQDVALGPLTPLKVQVTISRYQGEKKVSSLPYVLSVTGNDRSANLRMGARVALPTMSLPTGPDGKSNIAGGPVQYTDIGTYIDCSARTLDDGRFRLSISIEDSSVYGDDTAGPQSRSSGLPAIRSFKLSNTAILKDGQSTQFTTATDKLSGEVVKIDIALNVVK